VSANLPPADHPRALGWVLGGALLIRLTLAFTNFHTLILLNVPDDAFYYFQVARNVAAGLGSTFDGIHPTNGYHPLWLCMLVPFYRVLPHQPERVVNLALAFQALMDVGTTALIYLLVRRILQSPGWAVLAAALYAFNPNVVFYQIDGLETAVSTLLTVTVLYFYIRYEGPEFRSWTHRILFGVACGVMLLARTDSIFLGVGLFILCAVQEWTAHRQFWRTFAMGMAVTLLVAPWLAWNYLHFQNFLQVSALARPWVLHQHLHGPAFFQGLRLLKYELVYEWPVQNGLVGGVWVLLAAAAYLLTRPGTRPETPERGMGIIWLAWLALALVTLFHCFVRLNPRPWYSATFPVLNAVTIAWAARRIWNLPRARRGVTYALGIIFMAYVLTGLYTVQMKKYAWQGEFARAAEWLQANTPPDTHVGAFNSGIVAYLSHRTVINLDGVINNSSYYAMLARHLRQYVWDNSITYIADFRFSVETDYRPFWDEGRHELNLDREERFPAYPIHWEYSGMCIYRVRSPGAGPGDMTNPPPPTMNGYSGPVGK
jgi:hypothetical protein